MQPPPLLEQQTQTHNVILTAVLALDWRVLFLAGLCVPERIRTNATLTGAWTNY